MIIRVFVFDLDWNEETKLRGVLGGERRFELKRFLVWGIDLEAMMIYKSYTEYLFANR